MKYLTQIFTYGLIIFISGCAEPDFTGTPNPYQGTYVGTETLKGGSTVSAGDYPLKIYIKASGRIKIVDVDGATGYGKMKGNEFHVVRGTPRQIFDGTVTDKTISGVTTQNRYTGNGIFSLTMQ